MRDFDINPITKTDYPDPDIIRVDDVYYMASTTMHFYPGCAVLRSYDLVNWEVASYVFDKLIDTPAERLECESVNYGQGMWAPTLRYHDGTFYVAFVSHGSDFTFLFTAKDICGPWEKHTIEGYYHDLSLLFDDDGRVFVTYGNFDIHLLELKPDLSGPLPGGVDKLIVSDNREEVGLGYEGSHFYKINGKYYLFLINWPKKSGIRTQNCFVADSVDGEYKGGVVFSNTRDFRNAGVAQGGIIDTPGGKWFSVMFQDSGAVGRIPVIVPVKFVNDFPVFGVNGKVPAKIDIASSRPYYRYEPLYTSDDFKGGIKKQWQWNHVPNNDYWNLEPEGGYTIKTGKICINVTHAQNTLTQRMMFPKSEAEVTIDVSKLNDGDFAGLCAFQSNYGYVGVTRTGASYYLVNVVQDNAAKMKIGAADYMPGTVVDRVRLKDTKVTLCVKAVFEDGADKVSFFYLNDNRFTKIGTFHEMKFSLDHFVGARFALFAFSTKKTGGSATFTDFVYRYE